MKKRITHIVSLISLIVLNPNTAFASGRGQKMPETRNQSAHIAPRHNPALYQSLFPDPNARYTSPTPSFPLYTPPPPVYNPPNTRFIPSIYPPAFRIEQDTRSGTFGSTLFPGGAGFDVTRGDNMFGASGGRGGGSFFFERRF